MDFCGVQALLDEGLSSIEFRRELASLPLVEPQSRNIQAQLSRTHRCHPAEPAAARPHDYASLQQLLVLANMEFYNALLIEQGTTRNPTACKPCVRLQSDSCRCSPSCTTTWKGRKAVERKQHERPATLVLLHYKCLYSDAGGLQIRQNDQSVPIRIRVRYYFCGFCVRMLSWKFANRLF